MLIFLTETLESESTNVVVAIIQYGLSCLATIITALLAYRMNKQQKKNEAFLKMKEENERMKEEARVKMEEDHLNVIKSLNTKVDQIDKNTVDLSDEVQSVKNDIKDLKSDTSKNTNRLYALNEINFDFLQSLSDVTTTTGIHLANRDNDTEIRRAIEKHNEAKKELTAKLFNIKC